MLLGGRAWFALLVAALELVLRRTVLGKRIRAVAQSPFASRVVGIPIDSVRTVTFVGGNPCCSYGYHVIVDNGAGYETMYTMTW